jgi:hypothetical protein
MNVEERNHFDRLRELVNDADSQVQAASDAHEKGEHRAVTAAHRQLAGTIRSMRRTFDSLGKAGEQADQDNNKKTQNSGGMGEGTSGRGSPLYLRGTAGVADWLARARIGGRRS